MAVSAVTGGCDGGTMQWLVIGRERALASELLSCGLREAQERNALKGRGFSRAVQGGRKQRLLAAEVTSLSDF